MKSMKPPTSTTSSRRGAGCKPKSKVKRPTLLVLYMLLGILLSSRSGSAQVENKQAVVYVAVVNASGDETGHGSGTIISVEDNIAYILTAYHVVRNHTISGSTVQVEFFRNPKRYKAFMATDWVNTNLDLAVLRVESNTLPSKIRFVRFADVNTVREGDKITAIGHRTGGGYEKWLDDQCRINQPVGPETKFTKSVVEVGFSGGPILTDKGELAGIITEVSGGLGIAASISIVQSFVSGLDIPLPKIPVEEEIESLNSTNDISGIWTTVDGTAVWNFKSNGDFECTNVSMGFHATGSYQVKGTTVTGTVRADLYFFVPLTQFGTFRLSLIAEDQLQGTAAGVFVTLIRQ